MSDTKSLLCANEAFYAAFLSGDIDAMSRLWADDDGISCIHPGWPAIVGRTAVIGSWRDILQEPSRPSIACADPHPILTGEEGRVLCIEQFQAVNLAACNHFRRITGEWRLFHHQSSLIAPVTDQSRSDPSPPRGSLH